VIKITKVQLHNIEGITKGMSYNLDIVHNRRQTRSML